MNEKKEMSLIGHFEELRGRLILTLIVFLISLILSFLFVQDIYRLLVRDMEQKLVILGPTDVMWVYVAIGGVVAVAATIPVASYQTWKFVEPALSEKVRKVTLLYIPAISVLFIFGIAFGYWILFPMMVSFTRAMAGDFHTMYTADKYFTFMLQTTIPFGFLFEMPAIVMFLTRLGVLTPKRLRQSRKMAYFIMVIVAVIITPPDFVSALIVAVPLFLLYEMSITISKIVYRKQLELQIN